MFVVKQAYPERLKIVPFLMQGNKYWRVHSAFESAVRFVVSAIQPKDDDLNYVRKNVQTYGERLNQRN